MTYCACWDLSELKDWKGRVPMTPNTMDILLYTFVVTSLSLWNGGGLVRFGRQNYLVRFRKRLWFLWGLFETIHPPRFSSVCWFWHSQTRHLNNKREYHLYSRLYWASCTDDQICRCFPGLTYNSPATVVVWVTWSHLERSFSAGDGNDVHRSENKTFRCNK